MHAVVVRDSISDVETAQRGSEEIVVPRVKQAPSFVAGYWTRSGDGSNGQAMMVFESEDAARAVADGLHTDVPEGVSIEGTEVREAVASA